MGESTTELRLIEARTAAQHGDWVTAIALYRPLAELGSPQAMIRLADIYYASETSTAHVFQNYQAARYWFEKAYYKGGLIGGILGLGSIYFFGHGVPKNNKKSFDYYKTLEHTDCAVGLLRLGVMYEIGAGTMRNFRKARDLYTRSAKLGNIYARKNLGVLLWKHWRNPAGLLLWVLAIGHGMMISLVKEDSPRLRAWR
jgi:TPR repeat protein